MPPSPFQLIHNGDFLYDRSGNPMPADAIRNDSNLASILSFVVPIQEGSVAEEALASSKAFANRYLPSALHREIEYDLRAGYNRVEIEEQPADQEVYRQRYNALYQELYAHQQTHGDSEGAVAQRQKIVADTVAQWIDAISPEQMAGDIATLDDNLIFTTQYKDFNEALANMLLPRIAAEPEVRLKIHQKILKTFVSMPEWMQVLTHERGSYVTVANREPMNERYHGISLSSQEPHSLMHIYLSMFPFKPSAAQLRHTLREEILHELHANADHREDLLHDWNANADGVNDDTDASSKRDRWIPAALKLIAAIDASPDTSPALALIKETDGHGGSLMVPGRSNIVRIAELLVDVCDAEIYLRTRPHDKLDAQQAKEELIRAFGQEVYDVSREYLTSWINEAADILKKEIGEEKAEQYRQKWMENPLAHRITLTDLPQYKLGNSDLPKH